MTSVDRPAPLPLSSLPKALLVGVRLPGVSEPEFESSLDELERLVKTLGYRVVARVTQTRGTLAPTAVLGEGKLVELAALTGGSGHAGVEVERVKDKARVRREAIEAGKTVASDEDEDEDEDAGVDDESQAPGPTPADTDDLQLIAVDHEISPSQLRNLERATGITVLDRTGVIIEIFHRHAHSREARMQVEIARLRYESPRVRESPRGKERQAGRGSGEAGLELDRRKIRDRIAELKEQLEAIQKEYSVRRAQRQQARRVALVGYTNAGKSTLFNAITGAGVYVADQLFATLDPTLRRIEGLASGPFVLADTVGFIRDLPHDLVAAFKSTLAETRDADLLLHVVDAADAEVEQRIEDVQRVLEEIGAGDVPQILVYNKIDLLAARTAVDDARPKMPRLDSVDGGRVQRVWLSAASGAGIDLLREAITVAQRRDRVHRWLQVPESAGRLRARLFESGLVANERAADNGWDIEIDAPRALIEPLFGLPGGDGDWLRAQFAGEPLETVN